MPIIASRVRAASLGLAATGYSGLLQVEPTLGMSVFQRCPKATSTTGMAFEETRSAGRSILTTILTSLAVITRKDGVEAAELALDGPKDSTR